MSGASRLTREGLRVARELGYAVRVVRRKRKRKVYRPQTMPSSVRVPLVFHSLSGREARVFLALCLIAEESVREVVPLGSEVREGIKCYARMGDPHLSIGLRGLRRKGLCGRREFHYRDLLQMNRVAVLSRDEVLSLVKVVGRSKRPHPFEEALREAFERGRFYGRGLPEFGFSAGSFQKRILPLGMFSLEEVCKPTALNAAP
ncbi:hypothetical protein [Thermosulfurimonas sp. F29]|uniref:hypothetical protein n=1 Tax=Thermosulfurimonas sp. F29 TaxID=2867247 RepID=UPI001C82A7E9|nr:hypothetical protein [Thermosulfurimonas sp. F29]MBX6424212.1 hypothetical protein [Thermosulfurimonas sp. F29]